MASTQIDSRDQPVELDYPNLTVTGPATFSNIVTLQNFLSGYQWPRNYTVTGTSYNYVAPASAALPLTTQTVTINDFTTPPTYSIANYFSVLNNGEVVINTPATYAVIDFMVDIPATLSTSGNGYLFTIQRLRGATNLTLNSQQVVLNANTPAVSIVRLFILDRPIAGDSYSLVMQGNANFTATLQVSVTIFK